MKLYYFDIYYVKLSQKFDKNIFGERLFDPKTSKISFLFFIRLFHCSYFQLKPNELLFICVQAGIIWLKFHGAMIFI